MTAKRRAKILIMEFSKVLANKDAVKQCALICANQLVRNYERHPLARVGIYWREVKKELEKYEVENVEIELHPLGPSYIIKYENK